MKKLFKRVPAKSYESSYDNIEGIIPQIAKDTAQPWEKNPRSIIAVALALAAGETIKVTSPFGDDVFWTIEPAITGNLKEDEAFLLAGTGDMWEVRVCSDTDSNDYEEFAVRAESPGEAAAKVETVARRNPDLYFDKPDYRADHSTIQKITDIYEEEIIYDREGPR